MHSHYNIRTFQVGGEHRRCRPEIWEEHLQTCQLSRFYRETHGFHPNLPASRFYTLSSRFSKITPPFATFLKIAKTGLSKSQNVCYGSTLTRRWLKLERSEIVYKYTDTVQYSRLLRMHCIAGWLLHLYSRVLSYTTAYLAVGSMQSYAHCVTCVSVVLYYGTVPYWQGAWFFSEDGWGWLS